MINYSNKSWVNGISDRKCVFVQRDMYSRTMCAVCHQQSTTWQSGSCQPTLHISSRPVFAAGLTSDTKRHSTHCHVCSVVSSFFFKFQFQRERQRRCRNDHIILVIQWGAATSLHVRSINNSAIVEGIFNVNKEQVKIPTFYCQDYSKIAYFVCFNSS